MHRPGCFFKDGKQTDWQWQQSGSLHFFEKFAHLLPSGSVDAGVRHVGFPIQQKQILRHQPRKLSAFERVVLRIFYGRFHFPLALGRELHPTRTNPGNNFE